MIFSLIFGLGKWLTDHGIQLQRAHEMHLVNILNLFVFFEKKIEGVKNHYCARAGWVRTGGTGAKHKTHTVHQRFQTRLSLL